MQVFRQILAKFNEEAQKETLGLGILLGLATVLFLQQAWVPGFFHDGYLYAALGKNAAELGHWLVPYLTDNVYSEFNQNPPTYFIFEGIFFKIFGSGFAQARVYSALWPLALVIFLYRFLERHRGRSIAFMACLFFLLNNILLKRVRFPNMDFALMLAMALSLFYYFDAFVKFKDGKKFRREILWTGFFFGMALLFKQMPAFGVPFAMLLHLGLTRQWRFLLSPWPWLGFLLGLLVFSIWPIALYFNGKFHIFTQLVVHIIGMMSGQVNADFSFWTYFKHFSRDMIIPFGLALYGVYAYFKAKRPDALYLFFACWFLAVFIPLQSAQYKVSYYLSPLFPALGALAAFPLYKVRYLILQRVAYSFKVLTITLALVFLIFPVTTTIRRDRPIFQAIEVMQGMGYKPKNWAIIEDGYAYWIITSLPSYLFGAKVHHSDVKFFERFLKEEEPLAHGDWVIVMQNDLYSELWDKHKKKWPDSLVRIGSFKKDPVTILAYRNPENCSE